jgi:hypothetical protein
VGNGVLPTDVPLVPDVAEVVPVAVPLTQGDVPVGVVGVGAGTVWVTFVPGMVVVIVPGNVCCTPMVLCVPELGLEVPVAGVVAVVCVVVVPGVVAVWAAARVPSSSIVAIMKIRVRMNYSRFQGVHSIDGGRISGVGIPSANTIGARDSR